MQRHCRRGRTDDHGDLETQDNREDLNDLNRQGPGANGMNIPRDENILENLDLVGGDVVILRSRLCFVDVFLGVMSFCVVIVEMVLLFVLLSKEKDMKLNQQEEILYHLHNATTGAYMIQILVQPLCYIFLVKDHTIHKKFKNSGAFFFRYMALYNFTMVIDSIAGCYWNQLQNYDNIKVGEEKFGSKFNTGFTVYSSMVLNTRIMFVYLFLECAHDVIKVTSGQATENVLENRGNIDPQNQMNEVQDDDSIPEQHQPHFDDQDNLIHHQSSEDLKVSRKIGLFAGFACIILQTLLAVKYIKAFTVGSGITAATVTANFFVMVLSCLMIKRNLTIAPNILPSNRRKDGFVHMLNVLGACSFLFIALKVVLSSTLVSTSADQSYIWSAARHVSELVTIPTLIICVNVVDRLVPVTLATWSNVDHFLLPALLLGVLGMGVGVCVDQTVADVIKFIRNDIQAASIQILLEIGPSLYVAFLMDVSYKLVLIYIKLRQRSE